MVNVALDWRPIEEISAPLPVELLGLALAPDGRHVEHLPSSRPSEHSILEAKRRLALDNPVWNWRTPSDVRY